MKVPGRRPPLLLELDLTTAPVEAEPDDLIGKLRSRNRPRLRTVLRALHEAADDPTVRGLVVRIGSGLPWATAQELAAGLRAFAASGKPTVGWAETLGEGGNGTAGCVLAAACGEFWLQPSGEIALMGVASETTFLRGALDKLGVEPQLSKRHEYKNAADRIMRTEFTDAHREAIDAVTGSVWDGAVTAIAEGRGLPADDVRALAEQAPLSAEQARHAGLVDRLGYRDEVLADLDKRLGDDVQRLFADQWTPHPPLATRARRVVRPQRDVVALVEGHGTIVVGRGRPGANGGQMGSDGVGAAFRAARADPHVKAVVFRVDSPGGSAVASDTIWREVVRTREAGKPVIVSMGSVAGSGGYYVACAADVIMAQPATITGSIGVFGGKVVVADLLERVGLTTGAVEHGGGARMYSLRRRFTDGEQQRLDAVLDRIYAEFVGKVALGRGMTEDAVDAVARGRIWSGADAVGRGLVDRLGGLRDATALARERAGLPADAPLRPAVHVPPLARLGRPRSSDDPRAAAVATLPEWGEVTGVATALAAALGLPAGGALTMPGLRLH